MRTINLFMVMKTNSQNFTLQRIESMFLLINSRTERSIEKFKKTLKNFKNSKNQLLDAVIYGIYYRCGSEQSKF